MIQGHPTTIAISSCRLLLANGIPIGLLLLLFSCTAIASDGEPSLNSLIKIGLNHAESSMDVRRQAIDQARQMLAKNPEALPRQQAELGIAEAYLLYQSGNIEAATAAIRLSEGAISFASHPNIYVRSQSLLGGLLLTGGKRQQGLKVLERLFKLDLSSVEPNRVENARVNYASGLVQNGQILEASQSYELALLYALSTQNDVLGLSAGSNYISLLRNQGMSGQAEYWLNRLRPAMNRQPGAMATAALKLYDYGLMLSNGDSAQAIAKLEMFLQQSTPVPNLVEAHGEELYSDALLAQNRFPEALAAAERALTLLEPYPVEQPETRMAIVRSLLAMGNYSAATQQFEILAQAEISRPSNIAELHKLRLEHALGTADIDTASEAFRDLVDANQALTNFANRQQIDYYRDRLEQQRKQLESKLATEEQAVISAEAAIQQAQTNAASIRESSLRQQRSFTIGAVIAAALLGVAMIYLYARRQLQRRLRRHLREQNASLAALVESKSKDLVQNVTEQAQLKQALAERRHMEAVGQIAGHVAHDFNNLLQVIASSNDLLATNAYSASDKRALNASNQSVQSGSSTVRQLLAYSRNQQLEARVFRVSAYLNETAALFRSAIGDVNQLTINDQSEGACVKLDSGQLTASIINLLRNAAEAMNASGEIVLLTQLSRNVEGGPVRADSEQLLQFVIVDSGRGMDTATLEQASQPYYTTKPNGTGLGLSSVYGFALQSGGEVELESQVEIGSRVTLSFAVHTEIPTTEPAHSNPSQALAGCRVLIVEDNPLIAQTLEAILSRHGADSEWASTAVQAQTALSSDKPFDLLLSDVKIPGAMDGFDLAQWVRSQHPKVRIGMMSGFGPSVEEDFDVPVLAKPFTTEELVRYLTQRIGF